MAYSNTKIDYEYIINLIQNIVSPGEDEEDISPEERQQQIDEVKQYIEELRMVIRRWQILCQIWFQRLKWTQTGIKDIRF